MDTTLTCQHEGCGVVIHALRERRALHLMAVHGNKMNHETGHEEEVKEAFDLGDDEEESDDAGGTSRAEADNRVSNYGMYGPPQHDPNKNP